MDNKTNIKIFQLVMAIVTVGVVLFGIGLTRAFMDSDVPDGDRTEVHVQTSSNVKLTYTDCASTQLSDCSQISAALSPGDSVTKTFQIKNDTRYDSEYTLYFQELYNTFKNDDLVYKIENINTGEVVVAETPVPEFASLTKDQVIIQKEIAQNTTEELKMTITFLDRDYNQNNNLNAKFELKLSILKSDKNPVELIMAKAHTESPDFASVAKTDEGVYAMEDNYGMSYYFRGAVENNYVKFAGFYWKIIRINGDGSLRLIYDGTSAYANGESSEGRVALTSVAWNTTNFTDAKYVGYMYGGENGVVSTSKEGAQTNETSSNIKTELEAWYKEKIVDAGYGRYVTDVMFCNDRSTAEEPKIWSGLDTTLGYGANLTMYGARKRLITNEPATPTFICPENNVVDVTNSSGQYNNDWFTAEATDDNKGNGMLEYPVGLITLDEVAAAGGKKDLEDGSGDNQNYYLFKGPWYWSFSSRALGSNGHAYVSAVNRTGGLGYSSVHGAGGVAPVINISAEYATQMLGSGTMTDPYTIG